MLCLLITDVLIIPLGGMTKVSVFFIEKGIHYIPRVHCDTLV